MSKRFTREAWADGSITLWENRDPGQVGMRRAIVYPIVNPKSDPAVYRLRIEQIPSRSDHDAPGWSRAGGEVQWGADSTDRDQVEARARAWVADGIY